MGTQVMMRITEERHDTIYRFLIPDNPKCLRSAEADPFVIRFQKTDQRINGTFVGKHAERFRCNVLQSCRWIPERINEWKNTPFISDLAEEFCGLYPFQQSSAP